MMTDMKGSTSTDADTQAKCKEWGETTCPICMECPHNAVLLICSSHEKGCKSYICDTSSRHSNCLDRFKKLKQNSRDNPSQPSSLFHDNSVNGRLGQRAPFLWDSRMRRNLFETQAYTSEENDGMIPAGLFEAQEENSNSQEPDRYFETRVDERSSLEESGGEKTPDVDCLKCPLCRGAILGWMIVKEAREYLDLKPRSCARESCSFSGNYRELRRHARRVHPTIRPADVDPSRQRAWRHLERQREHDDILGVIRSAMPGAVVLGDYALENGDGLWRDEEWWTTFFLLDMVRRSIGSLVGPRASSGTWRRHQHTSSAYPENLLDVDVDVDDAEFLLDERPITRRRRRFERSRLNDEDENLLVLQDDDDDWEPDDDNPVPRRRMRFTRSRLDDEQQ